MRTILNNDYDEDGYDDDDDDDTRFKVQQQLRKFPRYLSRRGGPTYCTDGCCELMKMKNEDTGRFDCVLKRYGKPSSRMSHDPIVSF